MTPKGKLCLIALCWLCAVSPASADGLLAVIIDDVGYSAALGERTLALPGAFTLAVLPKAPHSARLARLAAEQGKEVMLHNPMSNTRGLPLDPGGLTETMDKAGFLAVLKENFELIPEAQGLNNHMGSLLTQEAVPLGWLMEFLNTRGAYFIDSRTTAATRAWETAQRYQVPSLPRDVFLDHDREPEQILHQLGLAVSMAKTRGYAVAIGHPYPETLAALEHLPAMLNGARVELVSISDLLGAVPYSLPRVATGNCLAPPYALQLHFEDPTESVEIPLPDIQQAIKRELPYTDLVYAEQD
ncbi:divergent polysaccharide deacetylase family protein [Marinimicrobium sp. ABcell2]|uniref:divergent polysaccharide deacetylase family protein n=1 Tax=Marinimicrobium sp. ABcell2 TaxID=3069751 RepID=UPI0027AE9038|nr:divergent polysaccharide deacetylase family protein [Marinimicrobium sp. ABcell2]MDQ2076561.1 divergent polysaccharide deacetylase family protein [Marinimicrobium sp. ABcell2]